jgi:hypothetical protein
VLNCERKHIESKVTHDDALGLQSELYSSCVILAIHTTLYNFTNSLTCDLALLRLLRSRIIRFAHEVSLSCPGQHNEPNCSHPFIHCILAYTNTVQSTGCNIFHPHALTHNADALLCLHVINSYPFRSAPLMVIQASSTGPTWT